MKIEDFIKEYNSSANKEECVKKHIVDKYVPYEEKIALCKNVVKAANYRNGKFESNGPIQYMFFAITLLSKYTDIDVTEGTKTFDVFNSLDSLGLIDMFYTFMPEKELSKMQAVLGMVNDDFTENERSLIAYLDTKMDAMNIALDGLINAIGDKNGENENKI